MPRTTAQSDSRASARRRAGCRPGRALSSNASLEKTATAITQPVLVVEYTGDQACFPGDVRRIVDAIASTSKRHERVRGDHHGRALSIDEEPGRLAAGRLLADWLRQTFPA